MKREELRAMIRALRALDRMNHQPFADLVGREFRIRRKPEPRCPKCHGAIDGWLAITGVQLTYCRFCTTFEEAIAYADEVATQRER